MAPCTAPLRLLWCPLRLLEPHPCLMSHCPYVPSPWRRWPAFPANVWPSCAGLSRIFQATQGCSGVSRFGCQALMRYGRRSPCRLLSRCPEFGRRGGERLCLSALCRAPMNGPHSYGEPPGSQPLWGGATWDPTPRSGQLCTGRGLGVNGSWPQPTLDWLTDSLPHPAVCRASRGGSAGPCVPATHTHRWLHPGQVPVAS